jgi:hypothetical protein
LPSPLPLAKLLDGPSLRDSGVKEDDHIGGLLDPKTGRPVRQGEANPEACLAMSWAFVLREQGEGRTRLIVRWRGRWPKGLRGWLANRLFWEPAHFIMGGKMLLTIKRLAEEASADEAARERLVHS